MRMRLSAIRVFLVLYMFFTDVNQVGAQPPSSSSSSSSSQNWFGCAGCCGYVAGAAGWACCRVRGALYSACFNNTDCTVVNSQCILGCCQCPFPFYRQNTCQQCELIPRVLGSQCSTTSECARDIFRAVCVNGVCQCASAYKSSCLNSLCQCVPRTLGDQCAQDLDCSINVLNSVCSGGTCQCAAGFSPNVCGQCVPGQPLNALGLGGGALGLASGLFGTPGMSGLKRDSD